jgi:hypothetical protein
MTLFSKKTQTPYQSPYENDISETPPKRALQKDPKKTQKFPFFNHFLDPQNHPFLRIIINPYQSPYEIPKITRHLKRTQNKVLQNDLKNTCF